MRASEMLACNWASCLLLSVTRAIALGMNSMTNKCRTPEAERTSDERDAREAESGEHKTFAEKKRETK